MTNSADPDQLASSEANWSGSTLFAKTGHVLFSKRRVKNLPCLPEDALDSWLPTECSATTMIRIWGCPGWAHMQSCGKGCASAYMCNYIWGKCTRCFHERGATKKKKKKTLRLPLKPKNTIIKERKSASWFYSDSLYNSSVIYRAVYAP